MQNDTRNFLEEKDIDNSITEKILRGTFNDPLLSSDSEEERSPINWNEILKIKNNVSF